MYLLLRSQQDQMLELCHPRSPSMESVLLQLDRGRDGGLGEVSQASYSHMGYPAFALLGCSIDASKLFCPSKIEFQAGGAIPKYNCPLMRSSSPLFAVDLQYCLMAFELTFLSLNDQALNGELISVITYFFGKCQDLLLLHLDYRHFMNPVESCFANLMDAASISCLITGISPCHLSKTIGASRMRPAEINNLITYNSVFLICFNLFDSKSLFLYILFYFTQLYFIITLPFPLLFKLVHEFNIVKHVFLLNVSIRYFTLFSIKLHLDFALLQESKLPVHFFYCFGIFPLLSKDFLLVWFHKFVENAQ